jgi:hypothetical protein
LVDMFITLCWISTFEQIPIAENPPAYIPMKIAAARIPTQRKTDYQYIWQIHFLTLDVLDSQEVRDPSVFSYTVNIYPIARASTASATFPNPNIRNIRISVAS